MSPSRLEHDWFPAPLPANIHLGEGTWLYSSFAFRHYQSQRSLGLTTGHDTGLYNGTFFNLGPTGQVRIGNHCTLVGAIISTNRSVVIRDYVFISHEVVLADSSAATPFSARSRPEDDPSPPHQPAILIGENTWIGAQAILLAGARIGEGAIVGAGSVINGEVPPYTIVAGNPPRIVRQLPHPSSYRPGRANPHSSPTGPDGLVSDGEVDP